MRYLPASADDERHLLAATGRERVADLFRSIPAALRSAELSGVPGPFSEPEIRAEFKKLAGLNADPDAFAWFLGGGSYRHEVSCIVDHVLSRAEFATAYTPYQPEIAQGTLTAIFEFQSLICQLTGMDVANASVYDGGSGLAEAALLSLRVSPARKTILVSRTVHPHHRAVVATYCKHLGATLRDLPPDASGRTDPAALAGGLRDDVAAVIVQSPSFLGVLEDVAALSKAAHDAGALCIVSVLEPTSLGIVAPPGALGADVVTGDAMCFANQPSFGGPAVGFFATREKFLRQMPGRLAGQTTDVDGKRGFVLTLSTREQHIRREKATSNICTNQGLVMLAATVGMCLYGKNGLRELAIRNLSLGEHVKARIAALPGYRIMSSAPTYNEFVVEGPRSAQATLETLRGRMVVAGPALAPYYPDRDRAFLVTVTEKNRPAEIDALVDALAGIERL